jgi:hypothetical protein
MDLIWCKPVGPHYNRLVPEIEEKNMIHGQIMPPGRQGISEAGRRHLLRQHPVLVPILLLGGSVGAGIVSTFSNPLFSLLAFTGVPVTLLYMSGAFVLGIAGIVASIISILEHIDRRHVSLARIAKPNGV